MNWESSVDIYTLPCRKYIASGELSYSTERSALCCDDLEGGVGEVGGEVQEGGDICLQVHRLAYKSMHLHTSPWAHIQVYGLAMSWTQLSN